MVRLLCAAFLLAGSAHAKEPQMEFSGSHPPDPAVLQLVQQYQAASTSSASIAARDEQRRSLVSPGYFYHGLDGAPIGFEGLTARQTKNDLQNYEQGFYDVVLHQYENTAIVTYKTRGRGMDKGKPFDNHGSAALIMSRTTGGWRVVADILGREPAPPADLEAASTE